MAQKYIELRGIKLDLSKISKIKSPILRETIKRLIYKADRNNINWKEIKHKEYHDTHSEYVESHRDYYRDHDAYSDYDNTSSG